MSALFVALGIMVVGLLGLLLWFVPHLLQQQATRVAGETSQLREMLLDLLNEQEAVTMRQTQLGSSLNHLQGQIETIAHATSASSHGASAQIADSSIQQIEARLGELQGRIQDWFDGRQQHAQTRVMQDNESWAHLLGLLAAIQDRVGALSQDRTTAMAGLQAGAMLEEIEQELQNLRSISEDIAMLQWRLRRSLHERETSLSVLRSRTSNGA